MVPVLGKIIKMVLKGQDSSLRACRVWHKAVRRGESKPG